MNKKYNFSHIEQLLYEFWETNGFFNPIETYKDSYCIMIPPPNITGRLHLGHAFQYTIIDVLIRYKRMQGKNTLWQMGMDHAGIATQIIVERKILNEEGKTRHDYSRDAFIKKILKWKDESRKVISHQMRCLGFSIDWNKERFTMDNGLSYAVKEAFIRLYKNNLIYRSKRLVNWDPVLRTAISDVEVEHRLSKGHLWYCRYPLAHNVTTNDCVNYLVVATTRPETIFGDTAVAVNPKDKRYQSLIGKNVIVPIINRYIPIIADNNVEINKGSGCVKVTPAHDFKDYEIGKRHKLPMINIFSENCSLLKKVEVFDLNGKVINYPDTRVPISFQGLNRFSARNTVIAKLKELNLLELITDYELIIPYGDRSGSIIEPMLTDQWYISILPLADLAIKAVKEEKIKFFHTQYKNMYLSWMNNIQDWCISRQLWWGHRIPAWYDEKHNIYVGHNEQEIRKKYNLGKNIKLNQDEDVLDTWFSSGLWTFSSLGWPKDTKDLKIFHPTDVIISGFDIIFFWIARMIMLTMYLNKDKNGYPQIPFKVVYITGLLRDKEGKKMSKSKGNIIDPLDIINGISLEDLIKKQTFNIQKPQEANKIFNLTKKQFPQGIKPYGTDALRFTLMSLVNSGRDIYWDMKRLEGNRNFCHKLWNASIFVIQNVNLYYVNNNHNPQFCSLAVADRWILSTLHETIRKFREALDNYRFDLATQIIYDFTWKEFCDWYLEFSKIIINKGNKVDIYTTCYTLIIVLEILLRLAHPIIPFITEHIWQKIKHINNVKGKTIMCQPFPQYNKSFIDQDAIIDVEWIKQLIITIRTIRSEFNILYKKPLQLIFKNITSVAKTRIEKNKNLIIGLANLKKISFILPDDNIPESIIKLIDEAELLIPIEDNFDKKLFLENINNKLIKITDEINKINIKLSSEYFIQKSLDKERSKLESLNKMRITLIKQQEFLN